MCWFFSQDGLVTNLNLSQKSFVLEIDQSQMNRNNIGLLLDVLELKEISE